MVFTLVFINEIRNRSNKLIFYFANAKNLVFIHLGAEDERVLTIITN